MSQIQWVSVNIIYADDITQIVSYAGSENMLARITANEIQRINVFENKWKIKTNDTRFQIIPIRRRVGSTESQSRSKRIQFKY